MMRWSRRAVLKSLAISSAGLAMARPRGTVASASGDGRRLLALVNDDPAGAAFLRGAMAAGAVLLQARIISSDVQALLALERELRQADGLRVIGLLDDATGTLVVDLARGAGARISWLAQHATSTEGSRHLVFDIDRTEDRTRWLVDHLYAKGAGYQTVVQRRGESPKQWSSGPRGAAPPGVWPGAVGHLLGSLATSTRAIRDAGSDNVVTHDKFVSFLIEV
nr:hypothetical protein [Gammaproteobacteria bacterium]